ncbi:MAG TPA: UDP-N-acetylmuramoyl-tripeptide--D-alanyl-D-alanine ligase [Burkholderiaceae bacterium]|nr:UDP-N-acetylmuramoyl-tripeptide--D-alanyl-D-alanine ligase [Burkholderiaceae bacterium]
MMTLAELALGLPGAVLHGDGTARFARVSTDTRSASAGCVFFALRGERFDAHDFVAEVVQRGAVGVVVERQLEVALPQIVVADTRRALGQAAATWRARFNMPVIAIAGSNGKTTVTQMIGHILAQAYGAANRLVTRGNLNNEIGVPLMLFELEARHRAAALELGMNHPGEIAWLAQIARPTVALVNNAQREHQEFMASVEATAVENGAAIAALPPDGTAVFPADDPCAPIWRELAGTRRVLDFARQGRAAVTAQYEPTVTGSRLVLATPRGEVEIDLGVPGVHNVHNALAATAATLAIGVAPEAIRAGLQAFAPVAGRGVRRVLANGAVLIDDSYNANPDSVRAAIDLLVTFAAPRVLILGDMGEVGAQGPQFHREVGSYARAGGIETLLVLGDATRETAAAFGPQAQSFADVAPLIEAARVAATPNATLLIKGSRFMRMERVVAALTENRDANNGAAQGVH